MSPLSASKLSVLQTETHGRVRRLTLSRAEQFNALSEDLLEALESELFKASVDPELRVVILAAEGKAFCAGHDLKQMRAAPSLEYYQSLFARCTKVMMLIQRMPQVVIARVQGLATAAGCQLVGMCDLAVASSEARFAVSGVNLGLFCSTPSVALSRNLSRKQAFEMLVTGEFISAQQALEKGLVNSVVEPERLDQEIERLTQLILAKPAAALVAGKGRSEERRVGKECA